MERAVMSNITGRVLNETKKKLTLAELTPNMVKTFEDAKKVLNAIAIKQENADYKTYQKCRDIVFDANVSLLEVFDEKNLENAVKMKMISAKAVADKKKRGAYEREVKPKFLTLMGQVPDMAHEVDFFAEIIFKDCKIKVFDVMKLSGETFFVGVYSEYDKEEKCYVDQTSLVTYAVSNLRAGKNGIEAFLNDKTKIVEFILHTDFEDKQ